MSNGFFLVEHLIRYLLAVLHASAMNGYVKLRHLDIVTAKTGLSPCGLFLY